MDQDLVALLAVQQGLEDQVVTVADMLGIAAVVDRAGIVDQHRHQDDLAGGDVIDVDPHGSLDLRAQVRDGQDLNRGRSEDTVFGGVGEQITNVGGHGTAFLLVLEHGNLQGPAG